MFRQPRVPTSCPVGFKGAYHVVPGDTYFKIAQLLQVPLNVLIASNPHIPNPNYLVPGDVLCVPPACCTYLRSRRQSTIKMSGIAVIHPGPAEGTAISVLATLPPPATFGNYERYMLYVMNYSALHASGKRLSLVPDNPNLWAAKIDQLSDDLIVRNTLIVITPIGADIPPPPWGGEDLAAVMKGDLSQCPLST